MDWKVVVQGGSPTPASVEALTGLTGLARDEILSALRRGKLVAASGLPEDRAQDLGDRLARGGGITCRILPDTPEVVSGPRFTVLLSGFAPGYRTRLRRKLQELTGLPPEQVVVWLSRTPFALARGVDADAARRIRGQITAAGGVVTVEADPGRPASRGTDRAVFSNPGAVASMREKSASRPSGPPPRPDSADAAPMDGSLRAPVPTDSGASTAPAPASPPRVEEPTEPGEPPVPGSLPAGPPPRSGGGSPWGGAWQGTPPAVFTPGPPAGRLPIPQPPRETAPVSVSEAPHAFFFAAPSPLVPLLPGKVGEKSEPSRPPCDAPPVVLLHPPAASLPGWMLLPGVPETRTHSIPDDAGASFEEAPPPVLLHSGNLPTDPRLGDSPTGLPGIPPGEEDPLAASAAVPSGEELEEGPPPAAATFPVPASIPLPQADGTELRTPPEEPPVRAVVRPAGNPGAALPSGSPEEAATAARLPRGRVRKRRSLVQAPGSAPPMVREAPPELASVHLYLCAPSTGTRDRVATALVDVLGMAHGAASDLVGRCPAWLAAFRSDEKAAEVQGLLEKKGVTVARTRRPLAPADRGPLPAEGGFHAWLSADG